MPRMNLEHVFTYHPSKEEDIPKYTRIREAAGIFAGVIHEQCPDCADTTSALRKVREAVMTANAAIALEGRL